MNQNEKQQAADEKVAKRMTTLMGGQKSDADFFVGELKYKLGIRWVDYGFPLLWKEPLLASPLFWSWWKDKWAAADAKLSAALKVVDGVLQHTAAVPNANRPNEPGHTAFYHTPEEFAGGYEMYHLMVMEETQMEAAVLAAIKKQLGITYSANPNEAHRTARASHPTGKGSARVGDQSDGLENIPV